MVTEIHDWNDLEAVNSDPNGHYVLQQDLDDGDPGYSTHGTAWPGIDIGPDGVFDGAGHHIQEWESSPGDGAAGLFNNIDGEVKDLRTDRFDMNADGGLRNGGFVGSVGSGGTVKRCFVGPSFARVDIDDGRAAGFAGIISGTAINCGAQVERVTSEEHDVHGFARDSGSGVEKCYAYASVLDPGQFNTAFDFAGNGGGEIDCYARNQSGNDGSDATILSASEMEGSSAETNMPEFDFNDVWQTESSDPPTLRDPPEPVITVDLAASGSGTGTATSARLLFPPTDLSATGSATGTATASVTRRRNATASGAGAGTATASAPIRERHLGAVGTGNGTATLAAMEAITPYTDLSATGSGTGHSDGVQPVRVRSMNGEGDGQGEGQTALSRRRTVSAHGAGSGAGTAAMFRVIPLTASGEGTGNGQAQLVIVREGRGVISSRENRVIRVTPRQYAELLSRRANTVLDADTIG